MNIPQKALDNLETLIEAAERKLGLLGDDEVEKFKEWLIAALSGLHNVDDLIVTNFHDHLYTFRSCEGHDPEQVRRINSHVGVDLFSMTMTEISEAYEYYRMSNLPVDVSELLIGDPVDRSLRLLGYRELVTGFSINLFGDDRRSIDIVTNSSIDDWSMGATSIFGYLIDDIHGVGSFRIASKVTTLGCRLGTTAMVTHLGTGRVNSNGKSFGPFE